MAIAAGLNHHSPLPLSRTARRTPVQFNPLLRFPCAPLLLRCPAIRRAAAATPPFAARDDGHGALSDPEPPSKSPLHLSQLLAAAAVAAAASTQAALAASGGSMGGCSDDSFSSSSFSSSYSDDSYDTSDYSSSSWTDEGAAEASEATHMSVGTAAELSPEVKGMADIILWGSVAMIALIFYSKLQDMLPGTTVVKLQVLAALTPELHCVVWMPANSFQKDLNQIADKVEASNRLWYKFILTETIRSLWRHKYYIISSSLFANVIHYWKEHFNKISIHERSKFDEETLSNLDGIKTKRNYKRTHGSRNEYIVLTILIAAQGALEFPEVRSSADLEQVVAKLNYIPAGEIRGIHVLWTPQMEDDVLSEEDIREDYPYLRPLRS
ncbi:hypothetical protein QOZ80_8AG0615800 [Eleusine coracana subsp. coracana]|nr:hypothetical protein QOZ80_8AG0615800 [Eleusine coracana subsp. coracana]